MSAVLIIFALIGAVLYGFTRAFRRRAQRSLEQIELPAELAAARAAAAATVKPGAKPVTTVPAAAATPVAQPHFMLMYDVGPDFLQRRAEFRNEHLALAWKASDAGELVLAGALEEGSGQAMLLFRGTREAALRFAAADPYVKHGLVKGFKVRQWHTTVGNAAAAPMRPEVVAAGRVK